MSSEDFKIIFKGRADDAVAVVELILHERDTFARSCRGNGWGWSYRAAETGRDYFLRQITGGISATEIKPLPAQGIVTATADETRSGSVERSEIEPGPAKQDAPEPPPNSPPKEPTQ